MEEILYDFENNIERDLKKDPYTYYKIEDYIDSKKEYIVNFYYSDGIFSNRLSIINKGNHLVVTGLKGLPGIMNHYAFSSFFVHKDSLQNFKTPKEPREIIVVDSSMVNVNYDLLIAYGQEVGGINDTIYIDSCCVKTQKIANPEILAYHNYDVFLKMGNKLKSIPVFEDFDDAEEFFKDKKGDKIFAKIYRFNPSRDDVVNTLFKEEIEGQVLIVKVYTVKYYKDSHKFSNSFE